MMRTNKVPRENIGNQQLGPLSAEPETKKIMKRTTAIQSLLLMLCTFWFLIL
jgi:hypothetical protein